MKPSTRGTISWKGWRAEPSTAKALCMGTTWHQLSTWERIQQAALNIDSVFRQLDLLGPGPHCRCQRYDAGAMVVHKLKGVHWLQAQKKIQPQMAQREAVRRDSRVLLFTSHREHQQPLLELASFLWGNKIRITLPRLKQNLVLMHGPRALEPGTQELCEKDGSKGNSQEVRH